jgi:hypothetical protein
MNMNSKGFGNGIAIIGAVILIGVVVYFFASKTGPLPTTQPTSFNFDFRYGVGAKNELDTFEKTYTRDMIVDPSVKIKMELTDGEMVEIYQKMMEINFFDYPDKFSVTVPAGESFGMETPCSSYYFKAAYKSTIKEVSWDDCITYKDQGADKLRELIRYIENVIESKEEYKRLPTPRGSYL